MKIPYVSRHAPLDQKAVELADVLEDREERLLARHALASGRLAGFPTVGGLLRWFEDLDPSQRKSLIDGARRKLGVKTSEERRIEFANRAGGSVAASHSPWQICHAPGCNRIPLNEVGVPTPTSARKWWCESHRDQAGVDDMAPYSSGIRITETGTLVPCDEGETARVAAEQESIRHRREAEQATRRIEAEARSQHEQAIAEQVAAELPIGFPGSSR